MTNIAHDGLTQGSVYWGRWVGAPPPLNIPVQEYGTEKDALWL